MCTKRPISCERTKRFLSRYYGCRQPYCKNAYLVYNDYGDQKESEHCHVQIQKKMYLNNDFNEKSTD